MSQNLSATRKPARKTVSPLLGKLLANEAEPNFLLLQPYIALDVLCRGKGTSGVVTILGQHLIISEQLCRAGFERAQLGPIRQGHAALVRIDGQAKENGLWRAEGQNYEALRDALQVYDQQLSNAPAGEIRKAHTAMSAMLDSRRQKLAEQQATAAR